MSELNYVNPKKNIILYLVLILTFGLGLRFYYVPTDLPIASDGFFDFVYAAKTVFEGSLPVGYGTTNTGWGNFLSLFFSLSDTSDPFYLMQIQRSLSIVLSTITIIPAFFIFRRFVGIRWALFGSFLLAVEPRLLLISLEGINYSLYFFLFVLTITLFLKKTNISLLLSFACIACATLVRYEGLLLLIPLSIMYFLKFKDKRLHFRYLRNYIDAGHDIQNQPLSQSKKEALTYLDNLMHRDEMIMRYDLKPGDMVFSDNHWIVHGRTPFEDSDDQNLKRLMLRTWIRDKKYRI